MNIKKDKIYYMMEIINKFNKKILSTFTFMESLTDNNPNVSRLKKLFILMKQTDEKACIELIWEKIWENRDNIREKNKDYFKNNDYFKYTNNLDDSKELFENLIHLLYDKIDDLEKSEEDYIWDIMNDMLNYVIEYYILTNHGVDVYIKNILNK